MAKKYYIIFSTYDIVKLKEDLGTEFIFEGRPILGTDKTNNKDFQVVKVSCSLKLFPKLLEVSDKHASQ